jgi:hypothetical protein
MGSLGAAAEGLEVDADGLGEGGGEGGGKEGEGEKGTVKFSFPSGTLALALFGRQRKSWDAGVLGFGKIHHSGLGNRVLDRLNGLLRSIICIYYCIDIATELYMGRCAESKILSMNFSEHTVQ